MQRDFIEPGGFGETLGNDLAPVAAIVPTVAALIALFRAKNWSILHTRESHKPDLVRLPACKTACAENRRCGLATAGRWGGY